MSFFTFKLDHPPERSTPIPIAAAGPRTPSKWQDGSAQVSFAERAHSTLPVGGIGDDVENYNLRAYRDTSKSRCKRSTTAEPRRKTTCISCQVAKARCESPSNGSKDKCRRCLRLNKECTIHTLKDSPQQSRLPADETLSLHGTHSSDHERDSKAGLGDVASNPGRQASVFFSEGFIEANLHPQPLSDLQKRHLNQKIDSIFSIDTAEQVFHHYINSFAPKCPIVVFPPGTTAAHVRETKPLLFLSILGIASAGYCSAAEQRQLALDVRSHLAERAIVRGEKSLELVQALQITSFWYRAPDEYRQMNLNQLAHIATTMAIDLGLDSVDVSELAATTQDKWDRAEAQRAWLGCFLLSASLSIILRRPNPTPWTAKLDDYLADLQQSKAADTDGLFCKLVATERLCHDIDQGLLLSDPVRSVPAWDPRTLAMIEAFQARNDWTVSDQTNLMQNSIIRFGMFASVLYSHELALHVNHNLEEFKAPFSAKSLRTYDFFGTQGPNEAQLWMLRSIVIASHGLMDSFLGLSVSDMLALPPHIYGGRVIYAAIVLIKIHTAITVAGKGAENFLPSEELRLETYLEQLAVIWKLLLAKDERNALSRAFLIIPQLKDWFDARFRSMGADADKSIDLPVENSQGISSAHVPTGTPRDFSINMQSAAETALAYVCQCDEIQPTFTSINGEGNPVTSDTWFSEFFNVEMLG